MTAPIIYFWDGDQMVPILRFKKLCDKQFVVGEQYQLCQQEDRSQVSHRHFFASVNEAWRNLPEDIAERFPTPDHLRKWALIKAGFADERSVVCASKAEALRVAAFIKPMDQYAVVLVSEATVKVYTAQSQSTKAMGKKAFQESKQSVLEIIADTIGVTAEALSSNADRAA